MRTFPLLSSLLCASLLLPSALLAQSTITTVSATPGTGVAGSPVTISATVQSSGSAAAVLAGTVQFFDGTVSLGNGTLGGAALLAPKTIPAAQVFGSADVSQGTPFTADVNGDGKLDIVMVRASTFQVLLNNGNGSYTPGAVQSYTIAKPAFLDYDHDGKLDIVYVSGSFPGSKALQMLKGDGTGSFATPVTLTGFSIVPAKSDYSGTLKNYGSTAVTAADVTGDGLPELLVGEVLTRPSQPGDLATGNPPNEAAVSVYRNNGNGTFTLAGTGFTGWSAIQETAPSYVIGLQVVDLNRDGVPDVVATVYSTLPGTSTENVSLVSRGDGTFGTSSNLAGSTCPGNPCVFSIASGDFSGRGGVDLAFTNYTGLVPTHLTVLPANGDGTFGQALFESTVAGDYPAIVALDLDGDGKTDLVDAHGYGYISNGDYTFRSTPSLASTAVTSPLLAADLTGDGLVDVYFTNTFAGKDGTVLVGQRGAAASLPPVTSLASGTHSITAAYSGSGNYAASTSAPVTVTMTPQTPNVAGMVTPATPLSTQAVTLSVKVTAANRQPTGKVTFTLGQTAIGTANLDASGNASVTYTFGTVGAQSVTASYAGDSFTAAGSTTIAVTTVSAFVAQPANGNTTLSTTLGGTATSTIAVTAQNGFSGMVNLACTGLPSGVNCSFNPASVTTNVKTTGNSTMTITVPSALSQNTGLPFGHTGSMAAAGVIAGLFFFRRRRVLATGLLAFALLGLSTFVTGCSGGGGSSNSGGSSAQNRTYTFQVVATSGPASTTTNYTLQVQ